MYGGFSGFESSISQRIWYVHPTIIHGGAGGGGGNPQNYLFRFAGQAIRGNGFIFERAVNDCISIQPAGSIYEYNTYNTPVL